MKKLVIMILATGIFLVSASFDKPTRHSIVENDWGEWISIPAYSGIYFRAKKGDYNEYAKKYYWYFQFRNQYKQEITFNYGYTPISQSSNCNPDHYKDLQAGEVSDITGALLAENNRVYVCVGEVKFLQ